MSTIRNQADVRPPVFIRPPDVPRSNLEKAIVENLPTSEQVIQGAGVLSAAAIVGRAGLTMGKYVSQAIDRRNLQNIVNELNRGFGASVTINQLPDNFQTMNLDERYRVVDELFGAREFVEEHRQELGYQTVDDYAIREYIDSAGANFDPTTVELYGGKIGAVLGGLVGGISAIPKAIVEGDKTEKQLRSIQQKLFPKTTKPPVRPDVGGVNVGPLSLSEAESTLQNQVRELQFDSDNRMKFDNNIITGLGVRIPLGTLEGNVMRHQNKLLQIDSIFQKKKKRIV